MDVGQSGLPVVFLDANISPRVCRYLRVLEGVVDWVSFWSLEDFRERAKSFTFDRRALRSRKYQQREFGKIYSFFDALGHTNLLSAEGPPPFCMKDEELLRYMLDLINVCYPDRRNYFFFTLDHSFFTQERVRRDSVCLARFQRAVRISTLKTVRGNSSGVKTCAREIRHRLEAYLGLPCTCYYIFASA